jgi:hypothetical protein
MTLPRPSDETLQWIGLLAAPAAWTVQLVLGFGAGLAACEGGGRDIDLGAWELGLTVAAAAVAVGGQVAAVLAWRATRGGGGTAAGRIHFLADAALLANTIFLVAILLGGLTAAAHGNPCRQA